MAERNGAGPRSRGHPDESSDDCRRQCIGPHQSGRRDSNTRPLAPKRALYQAELRPDRNSVGGVVATAVGGCFRDARGAGHAIARLLLRTRRERPDDLRAHGRRPNAAPGGARRTTRRGSATSWSRRPRRCSRSRQRLEGRARLRPLLARARADPDTCAAVLFLAFLLVVAPSRLRIRRHDCSSSSAFGLVEIALVPSLYFVAIENLPVGVALLIEFTAPLFGQRSRAIRLQGHVRRRIWVAVALCPDDLALVVELWAGVAFQHGRRHPRRNRRRAPRSRPTSSWQSVSDESTVTLRRSPSAGSSSQRCWAVLQPLGLRGSVLDGLSPGLSSTPPQSGRSSPSSSSSGRW